MAPKGDQTDEYFPRGGTGVKTLVKKRTFTFGKKDVDLSKKKKLGRRERKRKAASTFEFQSEDDSVVRFERVEPLIYSALSEGTLVLCSVREIYSNYVDICMPGRLSARLYVENVSEPYNEIAKSENEIHDIITLKNLFLIGQHLCCSVLSVKNTDHYVVRVSSDPKCVNSNMTFDNVHVGDLIQMAVQSCEDHGYMMYSGISGLISFLPTENAKSYINSVRNSKPLDIGQLLWCLVTKSNLTESSNTIHVSIDLEDVKENKLTSDISIDKLNPGVGVEITVQKLVSQNLMVTVSDSDIKGYIEPSHLSTIRSKPEDYSIGSKHIATVLYKFPYPRVVAFTLKSNPSTISKEEIEHGTIFKRAEIMAILKRGVALKLEWNNNVYKGVISVRRLGPNVDFEKLSTMFPIGNHIKCRVIGFDALEQVYSCTTEDNLLNEKYLSPNDLKVGEVVEVTIKCKNKGGLEVSVGEIRGFVPRHHVSDVLLHNPLDKFKLYSKQKAKALRIENNNVIFTLRPTLIKTRSLLSFENLNVGDSYFGTVKKIQSDSITVSFFGNLFIHIRETNLIESPNKYTIGELVKCYVITAASSQKKLPVFSLVKSVQRMDVTVGNKYDVRVKHISKAGVKCLFMIKNQSLNGFLPLEHMSDYSELNELVMRKYPYYSVIENAILFSVTDNIYSFTIKKSVDNFFQKYPQLVGGFNMLKENMILPASVSEIMSDKIMVCVPIPDLNAKVPVERENLPQDPYDYDLNQGISVKITKLNALSIEMTLTCILSDKEKTKWSISNVANFLCTIEQWQSVKMGVELECTVEEVKGNIVKVSTVLNIFGVIKSPTLEKQSFKKGQKIKAMVLYHDVIKNIIYLLSPDDVLKMDGTLDTHLLNRQFPGTVLYGNSVIIIVMIQTPKGGQLAFVPTKEDPNVSNYTDVNKIVPYSRCIVTLRSARTSEKINYWIGFANCFQLQEVKEDDEIMVIENGDDSLTNKKNKRKLSDQSTETYALNTDKAKKKEKSSIKTEDKRKEKPKNTKRESDSLIETENSRKSPKKQKTMDKPEKLLSLEQCKEKKLINDKKRNKHKINSDENNFQKKRKALDEQAEDNKNSSNELTLENIGGFKWDATPADLAKTISGILEDEGDDGELSQDSDEEKLPPKKMTPAEKRAVALEAERKIRLKEEELLQADQNPQTPEHFERLLLGQPNSSKFWIMYMAHYLEATEVDKARAVANRAMKQINVRFEEERLNVWIARLNLEHFYGTPELFKEVLADALKYNDEYEVYKRVLDIYAQSKNSSELEKMTNLLVKKHKEKVDCWLKCQAALMKAELYDKARNYLQRSLNILPVKDHCTLISRFALIENLHGFSDQAQALFENLLTSYPKRVDLWFVYVDMLVKSGSAHLARNVLERATGHNLPVRKMKAIYQKWLKLEEANGTPESVQQVKDAANEYVNNLTNSLKQPF